MLLRRVACSLALSLIAGTALGGCGDDGNDRGATCRRAVREASEHAERTTDGSGLTVATPGDGDLCSLPPPPAGPDAEGVCRAFEAGAPVLEDIDPEDPDDFVRLADVFDQAADQATGQLRRDLRTARDLALQASPDNPAPSEETARRNQRLTNRVLRWLAEHC